MSNITLGKLQFSSFSPPIGKNDSMSMSTSASTTAALTVTPGTTGRSSSSNIPLLLYRLESRCHEVQ
ncbi:hypothetical protein X975_04620, partial [Stegodyphus mimosarum]